MKAVEGVTSGRRHSNHLFRSGQDWWMNACVGRNGGPYTFANYADGYFAAAERLIDSAEERYGLIDCLVYPIAFNFRHAVELSIKHLNHVLPRLWQERVPTEWTHHLLDNWKPVKANLLRMPDFDPDGTLVPFVDGVLNDLLDIDPRGEVFRYPKAKNGRWYLHDHSLINLRVLYDIVERTRETFDHWNFTAGILWDQRCAAW